MEEAIEQVLTPLVEALTDTAESLDGPGGDGADESPLDALLKSGALQRALDDARIDVEQMHGHLAAAVRGFGPVRQRWARWWSALDTIARAAVLDRAWGTLPSPKNLESAMCRLVPALFNAAPSTGLSPLVHDPDVAAAVVAAVADGSESDLVAAVQPPVPGAYDPAEAFPALAAYRDYGLAAVSVAVLHVSLDVKDHPLTDVLTPRAILARHALYTLADSPDAAHVDAHAGAAAAESGTTSLWLVRQAIVFVAVLVTVSAVLSVTGYEYRPEADLLRDP